MNEWERLSRKAKMLKQRYPEGAVVQLGFMEGEPDMPAGLKGKVFLVDAIGQIHVAWENGRSLALNAEHDSFRVIHSPAKKRDEILCSREPLNKQPSFGAGRESSRFSPGSSDFVVK